MGPVSGIAVYFMIWWTILFAILPWGVARNDRSIAGADPGAPQIPHIKRKFLITTVIAALIWIVIFFVIRSDSLSFQHAASELQLP